MPLLLRLLPLLFGLGGDILGRAGLTRLLATKALQPAASRIPGLVRSVGGKQGLGTLGEFLGGLLGFTGGTTIGSQVIGEEGPGFLQRLPLEAAAFAGGFGARGLTRGALQAAGRNPGRFLPEAAAFAGFPAGAFVGERLGLAPDETEPRPELSSNEAQLNLLQEAASLDPTIDNFDEMQDLFFRIQAQQLLGSFV